MLLTADRPLVKAPYFDPVALRHELTALFRAHGNDAGAARPAVLDRLKRLLKDAHAAARAELEVDGKGRHCAEGLSLFQDELIHLAYDYTKAHVYRGDNPSDAERMTVVATGGYGRGMLAPGSDIDLLFLLPYKQTPWSESVVEYILYLLWDLGQKVGHATRTVEQCVRLSQSDITIRTAILDARAIFGDQSLFENLCARFTADVVKGSAREFIAAKLAERDERHKRTGESRYRVEPNIKDGKGGLRDLHTLRWLAKYMAAGAGRKDIASQTIFTAAEQSTFRRCEEFLWAVRCHLHFLTGRAEERLTFDLQPLLAERLGYARGRSGLKAVERFMKHFFLVAKDVGDLTTALCSALEIQQLKTSPTIAAMLDPMSWRTRRRIRRTTDFRIDNGRLNVADAEVFKRDPVNLIRFFATAEETGTFYHPDAVRLLRQSLRLIDDRLRGDPEANRIFLGLLTSGNVDATLRRMNEAGVLGRFIPDFGRIVAMMQFNMYHHYTLDEHLIRTVGVVAEIERGEADKIHPLSHRIFKTITNRRALYLAAFLHDIGKGRQEDHSVAGARVARQVAQRLSLSIDEVDLVVWLIENHLVMSTFAQTRDVSDAKTIRDFAGIVGTPERLKLLLVLTVADIRAVGPGIWNGWKGQLLRTLYYQTEPLVAGAQVEAGGSERMAAVLSAFRTAAAAEFPDDAIDRYIGRHYPDYWLKTEARKQIDHFRLANRAESQGLKFAADVSTDAFTAVTELSILAPNHPRLLALFAGACAAGGANIVSAYISTTRDGFAIDTFLLQREFEEDDERRRAHRIAATIESVLKGEVRLSTLMAKRHESKGRIRAFSVEPEVVIDNSVSDQFTVVQVSGLDRPGLLYEMTSAISNLSLDITSAHITTYGEKVVDAFYVTDLTNKKITAPWRQRAIEQRLIDVLSRAPAKAQALD